MCVCCLSNRACNAHAPYYIVICDLAGSTVFSISNKRYDFRKNATDHKMYFDFLYNFCLKLFML